MNRLARARGRCSGRVAAVLGLGLGFGFASAGPGVAARQSSPNIVLIVADDLGYGHLGAYGQRQIPTPNLDRLAAGGMRFTQAYAGSNVCAPSRSTLMTGLHTGHTPVRANDPRRFLSGDDHTLAEVLRQAGYRTGGFGKWGLGDVGTSGLATHQGFDEWFGQYHQVHAHFHYPFWLWHGERRETLDGNEGKRTEYAPDVIHAKAMEFVRRHRSHRFFLYLPTTLPHVELTVPDDSERSFRGHFPKERIPDPRPGYLGSEDGFATYAGMISRLDRHVGELLELLEKLKLTEDTLVMFTSDNGPQGSGVWEKLVERFNGNGPFRASKGHFYEGGIRVPLVVRWPGRVKPGSLSRQPVAMWDHFPTLAEVAGTRLSRPVDGRSYLPILRGAGSGGSDRVLYWEYPHEQGLSQAIRVGRWKAVRDSPGRPLELFDLDKDPGETRNLAASAPGRVQALERLMDQQRVDERPRGPQQPEVGFATYTR